MGTGGVAVVWKSRLTKAGRRRQRTQRRTRPLTYSGLNLPSMLLVPQTVLRRPRRCVFFLLFFGFPVHFLSLLVVFCVLCCGGHKLGNVDRMVVAHVSMDDPPVSISHRGAFPSPRYILYLIEHDMPTTETIRGPLDHSFPSPTTRGFLPLNTRKNTAALGSGSRLPLPRDLLETLTTVGAFVLASRE